jgi:hypothetical protein
MMRLVIEQPLFLPWAGYVELAKNADVFVHYDDVQLPRGSGFTVRVQVKTPSGQLWLSAPINKQGKMKLINESEFSEHGEWKKKHIKTFEQFYAKAQFYSQMISLAKNIYSFQSNNIAEFNINACEKIVNSFGLSPKFLKSSELGIAGKSTERLVNICKELNANIYVTAHGALNYLDYDLFEKNKIEVRYINYRFKPWNQQFGDWIQYVTSLDLIAAAGENSIEHLDSTTIYWRDFV